MFCLILLGIVLICAGVDATRDYEVPVPKIEVFEPRGLRVSIPDSPGISIFAFHGNINKEMESLDAGQISIDILRRRSGRWVMDKRSVRLRKGDILYYWLFVVKDGLGYRLDNGRYVVTDFISANASTTHRPPSNSHQRPSTFHPPTVNHHSSEESDDDSTCPEEPANIDTDLLNCQRTLVNMTQTMLGLYAQIEDLKASNVRLTNLITTNNGPHRIRLNGMIPPNEDPREIVKFILKEKLDLEGNITAAVKIGDNAIEFEVPTAREKIAILNAAAEKLSNSRISFSSSS